MLGTSQRLHAVLRIIVRHRQRHLTNVAIALAARRLHDQPEDDLLKNAHRFLVVLEFDIAETHAEILKIDKSVALHPLRRLRHDGMVQRNGRSEIACVVAFDSVGIGELVRQRQDRQIRHAKLSDKARQDEMIILLHLQLSQLTEEKPSQPLRKIHEIFAALRKFAHTPRHRTVLRKLRMARRRIREPSLDVVADVFRHHNIVRIQRMRREHLLHTDGVEHMEDRFRNLYHKLPSFYNHSPTSITEQQGGAQPHLLQCVMHDNSI